MGSRTIERVITDTTDAVNVTEDQLVQKAQEGSPEAFERLYEMHLRRVYALSLRMLSDPNRAEEATQDIFVRAWEKIDTFQFRSAFGTWLHRLGVNVILGNLKSEKRRDDRTSPVTDELDLFVREVQEAMPETRLDLERAIAELPPRAKEILILHDIQGFRYREIAEMIGTAEGTVKSQLNRARRLVREAMSK
jgi:RNA polymerase sigma-70 factor (ECF subfamily)